MGIFWKFLQQLLLVKPTSWSVPCPPSRRREPVKSWVPPDAVVRGAVQGGDTRVQGTFKGNLLVRACAAQLPGKRKQTLWAHRNMSIDPFDSGAAHGFIYYHLPTRCATRSSGRAARRGVRTVGGQAQRRCVGVPASWDLSESEYFYCLRIKYIAKFIITV